uniref:Protein kinase domain-containing protein n=1 Tax=Leersia perrieri TaxID=77586 RepID=A0A0D9WVC5_9ORYZ
MYTVVPDSQLRDATVKKFLKEIAGEKLTDPVQGAAAGRVHQQLLGPARCRVQGHAPQRPHPRRQAPPWRRIVASMAEVGTIGRIHHINLVRLFGFCFDAAGVRALLYEYIDHGSLDAYLFDGIPRRDIAVGVARGLRYLHEECQQHKIVHYDIKPGNILLAGGDMMTAKVADFGLARLVNRGDTHVSVSGMRGTPGYAAPEMWTQAGVTEKCDVYSFGILLFEIARRRRRRRERVVSDGGVERARPRGRTPRGGRDGER